MMGQEKTDESSEKEKEAKKQETPKQETPKQKAASETAASSEISQEQKQQSPIKEKPIEVQQAAFQPLESQGNTEVVPKNIDLIMDVPLQISVVLGRTKKKIKDILNLGTGSLIELDKLAEEPVEILVNGKKVAYGEVVVIDENFGVRITGIVSNEERIKSLHTS
jgi:flagellar motor switch protein FliN/FliY